MMGWVFGLALGRDCSGGYRGSQSPKFSAKLGGGALQEGEVGGGGKGR